MIFLTFNLFITCCFFYHPSPIIHFNSPFYSSQIIALFLIITLLSAFIFTYFYPNPFFPLKYSLNFHFGQFSLNYCCSFAKNPYFAIKVNYFDLNCIADGVIDSD
jgi:hypothetical protein